MSRIGNKVIVLPSGVTLNLEGNKVTIKGSKGESSYLLPEGITLNIEESNVHVLRKDDSKKQKELHGTTRANLHNIVVGVSEGYSKTLEIVGIGYRASMRGSDLVLNIGHAHEDIVTPEEGVTITCKSPTEIIVSGIDKQAVGQTAARIREKREPEPYKGKGIKYKGEFIIRKEGKRTGKK